MKALPKRKGNCTPPRVPATLGGLNESLHLKLQNKRSHGHLEGILICLIESLYKTVGKFELSLWLWSLRRGLIKGPSHKVREIQMLRPARSTSRQRLNESPSKKGREMFISHSLGAPKRQASMKVSARKRRKGQPHAHVVAHLLASMKAPPKRREIMPSSEKIADISPPQ